MTTKDQLPPPTEDEPSFHKNKTVVHPEVSFADFKQHKITYEEVIAILEEDEPKDLDQ